MSTALGRTDVHVDNSLGVCPAAPRKEPLAMVAAEEYMTTCEADVVLLETSMRR
jgi:hypothetical protein